MIKKLVAGVQTTVLFDKSFILERKPTLKCLHHPEINPWLSNTSLTKRICSKTRFLPEERNGWIQIQSRDT